MAAGRKREVLDLPALPTGLATKLGQLMIAVLAVATAVFAFMGGDDKGNGNTPQTVVALGGTIVTALTVMGGRYAQTCALLKQVPSPVRATANGIAATSPADGDGVAARTETTGTTVVIRCCHCADHTHD